MSFVKVPSLLKAALCLLAMCTFAQSEEVMTSITGRRVPVRLVQQHFVKQLDLSDHKKNIIYELTERQVLLGNGLHLDLRTEARPIKTSSQHPFTVTLNGKPREAPSAKLKIFRVKSYDVIIDEDSGRVVSVTGNGIVLAPLHRTAFPGVFVNKRVFAVEKKLDLSVDYEIAVKQGNVVRGGGSTATEFGRSISEHQSGGSCANGTMHYLEIAVAYDNSFCALYGDQESTTTEAVKGVVDKANVAYAENTCVQLDLVHVEAHCKDSSDPYRSFSSLSALQIRSSFREIWMNSRKNVARDSAYLITGFVDRTSVVRIAGIATACDTFGGYGWVEGPSEYTFAHEVGHTLGGHHTAFGIMSSGSTSNIPFSFSSVSVQEFADYLDNNPGSSCVETTRREEMTSSPTPPPSSPNPSPTTTKPASTSTTAPSSTTATTSTAPPASSTTSTTSTPVSSSETCESGFAGNSALACQSYDLFEAYYSTEGRSIGTLVVSISQQYGQFRLMYRTSKDVYISRYRDLVLTEPIGSLGPYISLGRARGPQTIETRFEAGDMLKPAETTSCCEKTLYIKSDVEACVPNFLQPFCDPISITNEVPIKCSNVCGVDTSAVFVPMSASQKCPSCT